MWTISTGLGIAAASGHESTPIRWAWVSGNPAGMSQRRSGGLSQRRSGGLWISGDPAGIESEAGRRALSQRRAGGHWVRGDPVAWSPAIGTPGGAATRELGNQPAGLGEPPLAADISRDRRAWGLAARGLAALAAIPPNSHAVLQWAKAGGRVATSLPRDRQTGTKQNTFEKKENKTGWMGAAYGLGLVFCHGAHSRDKQEHSDEDVNSNNGI